jgi:hypothetical protein
VKETSAQEHTKSGLNQMVPGLLPLDVLASRDGSKLGGTLLLLFVITQALDGAMTYVGVRTLGVAIEANPLITWYAAAIGAGNALAAAKLLAIGCGLILYTHARHAALAALTAIHVTCAILPWTYILWWGPPAGYPSAGGMP